MLTPNFKWLLFWLDFSFCKRALCLKIHQKQVRSDQGLLWRGSVWAKVTQHVHRCCFWMNSFLYSPDRLSKAGKVLVYYSQNVNGTHLSTCAHSKHCFLAEWVCEYGFLCVCVWSNKSHPHPAIASNNHSGQKQRKMYNIIKWTQIYETAFCRNPGHNEKAWRWLIMWDKRFVIMNNKR